MGLSIETLLAWQLQFTEVPNRFYAILNPLADIHAVHISGVATMRRRGEDHHSTVTLSILCFLHYSLCTEWYGAMYCYPKPGLAVVPTSPTDSLCLER